MSGSVGGRYVNPLQQLLSPDGTPYNGAQLFFYATGTNTQQATYADAAFTIPNPQPVLTNAAGFFPPIFLLGAPSYRVVCQDPTGAVLFDSDPVNGLANTAGYQPGSIPIGAIMPYGGGTPPAGWLACGGQAVSRAAYAPLYAVIGTAFGTGDGSTTFNIPDLRGNVAVGKDDMTGVAASRVTSGISGLDGSTIGAMGGNERLQTHLHSITDQSHTHADSGHFHYMATAAAFPTAGGTGYQGGTTESFGSVTQTENAYTGLFGAYTGISSTNNSGAGASQNIPPSLVVLYMIRAN